jgi:hypothetical protein
MNTLPSFTSPVVLQKSPKNRFLIGSEHVAKILQNAGLNRHLESQLIASCIAFNELSEDAQMNPPKDQFWILNTDVSISVRSGHIMIEIYDEEMIHSYKCISHSDIVFTETTL